MSERKDIFKSKYKGPKGRHLSCITETTRYGSYAEDRQVSIHPTGHHNHLHLRHGKDGSPAYERRTTVAPVAGRNGYLAKASKELDRRRRDHASTLSSSKTMSEGTYKAPGSMSIR